jgi:hypothetical protein
VHIETAAVLLRKAQQRGHNPGKKKNGFHTQTQSIVARVSLNSGFYIAVFKHYCPYPFGYVVGEKFFYGMGGFLGRGDIPEDAGGLSLKPWRFSGQRYDQCRVWSFNGVGFGTLFLPWKKICQRYD